MPATTQHNICHGLGCEECNQSGIVRNYFEIPAENLDLLQEKIVKLNKKAVKLGTQPITLEVIGEHEVIRQSPVLKVKYVDLVKHVVVHGETPCINGWLLVAKITPVTTGEGNHERTENLVSCVPGQTVPGQTAAAARRLFGLYHGIYIVSDLLKAALLAWALWRAARGSNPDRSPDG